MAWIKVPKEHHALFLEALPESAADVSTMPMFGGIAVTVNGNIAAGLFGRSVMLRLDDAGSDEVLAMEGGAYFDPMGRGMRQAGKVMLPEALMTEPAALRLWIGKAIALARALPPKKKKKASAKKKAAPATKKAVPPKRAKKKRATRARGR